MSNKDRECGNCRFWLQRGSSGQHGECRGIREGVAGDRMAVVESVDGASIYTHEKFSCAAFQFKGEGK